MLGTSTTYEVLIHEARKVILHCASDPIFTAQKVYLSASCMSRVGAAFATCPKRRRFTFPLTPAEPKNCA